MHARREMSTGEQSLYTDGGRSEMSTRGNLCRSGDIERPSDVVEVHRRVVMYVVVVEMQQGAAVLSSQLRTSLPAHWLDIY